MNTNRLWHRAQQYIEQDQITAARITLESLLQHEPAHVPARMLLASTILSEGRVREAAIHTIYAARRMVNDADAICMAAHCLMRLGETVSARDLMLHPEIARTSNGRALLELSHTAQALGDHPEALKLMNRAKAAGYDSPDFRYFRSLQLQFNGHLQESEAELEACLKLGPTFGRASLALARLRRQTAESNHLDYIRSRLEDVEPGSQDHAGFEFALYKELEDLGRYDEAFSALTRGNAIMHSRLQHDSERERTTFDALIARCTPDFLGTTARKLSSDGPQPIFIIGLPRSGTTLMDRILSNHSMVTSAGERNDFPRQLRWTADLDGREPLDPGLLDRVDKLDYALLGRRYLMQTQWRAQGKPYFVDKLPVNFMLAGFIHRALPKAPILHMVRDPMDVCYSNYKALFGDGFAYSYNPETLAAHHHQYRRVMRHWHQAMPGRILDVNYNELVTNPDNVIPRILTHCGLPYEAGCEDLSRNASAVATLSSSQVRDRIHTRSLGEWKRYAPQLEPLQVALQHPHKKRAGVAPALSLI